MALSQYVAREGKSVEHTAVEGGGEVLVGGEGKGVVSAAVEGGGQVLVDRTGEGVICWPSS